MSLPLSSCCGWFEHNPNISAQPQSFYLIYQNVIVSNSRILIEHENPWGFIEAIIVAGLYCSRKWVCHTGCNTFTRTSQNIKLNIYRVFFNCFLELCQKSEVIRFQFTLKFLLTLVKGEVVPNYFLLFYSIVLCLLWVRGSLMRWLEFVFFGGKRGISLNCLFTVFSN